MRVDDDKLIIEEILGGETDTFRILIERYQRLVAHIVFRLIPNPADREEICQEIFIKVYQHLGTFKFSSKLSTWIGRIAFNTSMNHLRKEKMTLFDDFSASDGKVNDQYASQGPDIFRINQIQPDTFSENDERYRIVQKCVTGLPAPYRLIITLFHLDELSYQEIAAITGLPEGTIKSHLFRGRRLLKEKLVTELKEEEIWT
jgi:RNA polymerase sigma factor (sigma-70 family)